jgi:hypothetical protein
MPLLVSSGESEPLALRRFRSIGAIAHLDQATVLCIEPLQRLSSFLHRPLQLVDGHARTSHGLPRTALHPRVRCVEVAVCGHDSVGRHARRALERVDVLRVASAEDAAIGQQPDEVVRGRRRVLPWPHGAGETIEGFRVIKEVVKVEDGLREGKAVLLQLKGGG